MQGFITYDAVMSVRLLLDLHEETWGQRLRRAREASGLTLEEAAKRVSRLVPCSAPTLHRLERLDEAPTEWRRMVLAWLTVVAYGYKPSALDLPENPFPVPMREFDTIPDVLGQPSDEPQGTVKTNRGKRSGLRRRQPACVTGADDLAEAA